MSETTLPDPGPAPKRDPEDRLAHIRPGRYVEFEQVGKGGMGIVFLALDTDLNRRVAMKVVRPNLDPTATLPPTPERLKSPGSQSPMADAFAELKARFLREATVTGAMEHPGIVPVYELGQTKAGVPYYTMRYVRGNRTLRGALIGRPTFSRRVVLLEPFLKVCDTLAYAHDRGVIHRDLKPANVALGEYGEVIVLDWGLAKVKGATDEAAAEWQAELKSVAGDHDTVAGAIGTPGFMSPEAARGDLSKIGHLTDVYSLGVLLFEILAGRLPVEVTNLGAYMTSLLHEDAPRADKIDAEVPQALADICAHALTRDSEYRVQSAAELAARVRFWEQSTQLEREVSQRFDQAEAALAATEGVSGDAVRKPLDRAISALARAREVMPEDRRIPALDAQIEAVRLRSRSEQDRQARRLLLRRVGLAALVIVAIGAFVTLALVDAERREALHQRSRADTATVAARAANRATERSLAGSYTVASRRFAEERRGAAAALAASHALALDPSPDAWLALGDALKILPPRSTLLSVGTAAKALAFDPHGTRLAAAGEFGLVRVWDVRSGRATHEIPTHAGNARALHFLGTGDTLVWAGGDGTLRLLDLATEQVQRVLVGPQDTVNAVAALAHGSGFLAVTEGGLLLHWALPSGKLTQTTRLPHGPLTDVAVAPGGSAWIRSRGGALLRVDATAGTPETVFAKGITHLARWDRGRRVLFADDAGRVHDVDATTGASHRVYTTAQLAPEPSQIRALAATTDRAMVVLANGAVRVLHPDGGVPATLGGAGTETRHAAIASGGRFLATSDADHRIRLWTDGRNAPTAVQDGHSMSVTGVLSRGPKAGLVTAAKDGTVIVWTGNPPEPTTPIRLSPAGLGVHGLALAPDGNRAYAITPDPAPGGLTTLVALDLDRRSVLWRVPMSGAVLGTGLLVASSDAIYTLGGAGTVAEYDPKDGTVRRTLGTTAAASVSATMALALSADGTHLVRAVFYGQAGNYGLRVIDLKTNTETEMSGRTRGMVSSAAISPDGRLVALGALDGTCGIWERKTGRLLHWIEGGSDRVFALRFTRDGSQLLTGGDGIRVYDTLHGTLRERWDGHAGAASALDFNTAGTHLYSAGYDGTVRQWELDVRGPIRQFEAPAAPTSILFAPDDSQVFVGLTSGQIEVRNPESGHVLRTLKTPIPGLLAFERGVERLALSADGRRLAVADSRHKVHVYDLATGAFVGAPRAIERPVTGLGLSADGKRLYVASGVLYGPDMPAALVELENTRPVRVYAVDTPGEPTETFTGHTSRPTSLAVLQDGRVAYGVADGRIYLRTPGQADDATVLIGHTRVVTDLHAASDTDTLLSAADGETVRLWHPQSRLTSTALPGRGPLASARDGTWLARAEARNPHSFYPAAFLRVWAPRANGTGAILPGHARGLGGLGMSADGNWIWTIGQVQPGVKDPTLERFELSWWRQSAAERMRALQRHTGLRLTDFEVQPARSAHFTPLVEGLFDGR